MDTPSVLCRDAIYRVRPRRVRPRRVRLPRVYFPRVRYCARSYVLYHARSPGFPLARYLQRARLRRLA